MSQQGEVLELVPPDQIHNKLERFNFDGKHNPEKIAVDLIVTMLKFNGMGISANQVGLPHRVFVMNTSPQMMVCFNPKIVDTSEEQVVLDEGCLSYPGLFVKIRRPKHVRVRFQTPNGEMTTQKYTGMTARVFQHEMDHMEGIDFLSRASEFHKEKALRKFRLASRKRRF